MFYYYPRIINASLLVRNTNYLFMLAQIRKYSDYVSAKRWRIFFVKALILLGALFLIGYLAPSMPAILIALIWAGLTAISTISFVYFVVDRKKIKQIAKYKEQGRFAKLNSGRVFWLIAGFVISAIFAGGILFSASKWNAIDWLLIALSIPLYYGISTFVDKYVDREYKPQFRNVGIIRLTSLFVIALLCVICLTITPFIPSESYGNFIDALLAADKPFINSPSSLAADIGNASVVSDIVMTYGIPKVTESSFILFVIGRLVMYASILVSIVNLLNLCYLNLHELRKVFAPLPSEQEENFSYPLKKKYIALTVALSLCLVGAFIYADHESSEIKSAGEHTSLEILTHEQLNAVAYLVDGKDMDQQIIERILNENSGFSNMAQSTIDKLLGN